MISGDRVTEIYEKHRAFMFGIAYSMTRNKEDADDIVQDTAIRILTQRIDPPDDKAFVYTLVRHAAIDFFDYHNCQKRDVRLRESLGPETENLRVICSAEELALMREEIASVDPIVAWAAVGYSHREIGLVSGRKENAVSQLISKWRRRAA